MPTEKLMRLIAKIRNTFNTSELKDICLAIGFDYENFNLGLSLRSGRFPTAPGSPGLETGDSKRKSYNSSNINDFSREFVEYCQRREIIERLIKECHSQRPQIDWNNLRTQQSFQVASFIQEEILDTGFKGFSQITYLENVKRYNENWYLPEELKPIVDWKKIEPLCCGRFPDRAAFRLGETPAAATVYKEDNNER